MKPTAESCASCSSLILALSKRSIPKGVAPTTFPKTVSAVELTGLLPQGMAAETAAADVETRGSGLVIQGSRSPNAEGTGPLPIIVAGKEAIGAMMLTIVEAAGDIVDRSCGFYSKVLGM